MADIVLSKEGFGLKLYNRFPPRYREDDADTNYALRRYLEAIAEGGFSYAIDEWNGILKFADPDQATPQALPILFKQFGLEVFNGIPEAFLRYLLPRLGSAWSKKGGLDVIEFVASSISGVKTSTVARSLPNGEVDIDVRLEMDFSLSGYFPDPKQLARILTQFLPFYLGLRIIYVYVYHDRINIIAKDEPYIDHVVHTLDDIGFLTYDGCREVAVTFPAGTGLNYDFILNDREQIYPVPDVLFDRITHRLSEDCSITSRWAPFNPEYRMLNVLSRRINDNFYLNGGNVALPFGFHYYGSLNNPEFHSNRNFYYNDVFVEVDQHFDVIKHTPTLDIIDLGSSTDSRKDHVVISPTLSPMLNCGFTLNDGFTTNLDNCELGVVDPDTSIFDRQTTTYHDSPTLDSADILIDNLVEVRDEDAALESDDQRIDHLYIGFNPMFLSMLNTGFTLNSGFELNQSNVELGGVHTEEQEDIVEVSYTVFETGIIDSVKSYGLSDESLNTSNGVLNQTLETNDSADTDHWVDHIKTYRFEDAGIGEEETEHENVTMGSVVCLFPMLNTGDFTLNSGFTTNYSNVDVGDIHAGDEISNTSVTSKVSEVAVFVPPVLGMLTNVPNRVLNDSGLDVPDGYDTIHYRDGTKTVVFF